MPMSPAELLTALRKERLERFRKGKKQNDTLNSEEEKEEEGMTNSMNDLMYRLASIEKRLFNIEKTSKAELEEIKNRSDVVHSPS